MRRAAVPAGAGAFAFAGVGRDQDLGAAADDAFHLVLVSVAGVGQDDLELVSDASGAEFALGSSDHRLEVPDVR